MPAARPRSIRLATLDCWVVEGGATPKINVVMLHGFGAPGTDLVGLALDWIAELGPDAKRFRFLFPVAPGDLRHLGMPDGRAWWPINMAQLAEAVQADRFSELHPLEPDGIVAARTSLVAAIGAIGQHFPGDSSRLVLGGFSQGAMLAMDCSLRGLPEAPEMLFLFSGTLVCQAKWTAQLKKLEFTKVFQSHGTYDPILPFESAQTLHDLLVAGGVDVTFESFAGPHTISGSAIRTTANMLAELP